MKIKPLIAELKTDPLHRGYAGMSVQQVVDSLNQINREIKKDTWLSIDYLVKRFGFTRAKILRETIRNADAFMNELLERGILDFNDPDVQQELMLRIGSSGLDEVARGTFADLAKVTVTRADECGIGKVNWQDIEYARNAIAKEAK